VRAFEGWDAQLGPEADDISGLLNTASAEGRHGWLQVYAPGSIVCRRGAQGLLVDIEIVNPELVTTDDGTLKVYYRYKSGAGVRAMTPADQIEAVGDQWSFAYWNPETNECADAVEDLSADELSTRNVDRPIGLSDSLTEAET